MENVMKKRTPGYWLTTAAVMIQGCACLAIAGAQTPRRIAVGVYFNEGARYCPDAEQSFTALREQTGRLAKLYMNFQSWTEEWNQFSTRLGDNSLKHGGVFMVVWLPGRGEDLPGHSDPHWSCKALAVLAGRASMSIPAGRARPSFPIGPHFERIGGWQKKVVHLQNGFDCH